MYVPFRLVVRFSDLRGISVVVLSERITDNVKMCEIRSEIYGASDHCPVTMEIDSEVVGALQRE